MPRMHIFFTGVTQTNNNKHGACIVANFYVHLLLETLVFAKLVLNYIHRYNSFQTTTMEYPNQHNSSTPQTAHAHSTPSTSNESPKKETGFLSEILWFAFIAFIIVLPIRFFIAQPFIVSGASMEETFHTGEYLIVDQLSYRFHEPKRGDVIVFRYPKDPSKFFIKRIVGVPGDIVEIEGDQVEIMNEEHPEGYVLDEPYVEHMTPGTSITEELGENEYFVMGDNRDASSDSRMWGVLHRDKIIGQAFLRLFPFTEVEVTPGEYRISIPTSS